MDNEGTLTVANAAQKVLFEKEIKGQLSDGHWENARPYDHWKPWCSCQVVVDPESIGRDFWVLKDNYGLTSRHLLDVVGNRMLTYVNLVKLVPALADYIGSLPDSLDDWNTWIEYADDRKSYSEHYVDAVLALMELGVDEDTIREAEAHLVYSKRDMLADLKGLKEAFKTQKR